MWPQIHTTNNSTAARTATTATRATTIATTTTIAIAMLEVQRTAAKQRKHIRNRPAAAGKEASMATEAVGQPGKATGM